MIALYSAGKDKVLHQLDMETGKTKYEMANAHEYVHFIVILLVIADSSTINRLLVLDTNLIASGDEDGVLRIWDIRSSFSSNSTQDDAAPKPVREYVEHEDYIADMVYSPERHTLISVGYIDSGIRSFDSLPVFFRGDGFLSVFDIRKKDLVARSDNMDEEILSVAIMKVLISKHVAPLTKCEGREESGLWHARRGCCALLLVRLG